MLEAMDAEMLQQSKFLLYVLNLCYMKFCFCYKIHIDILILNVLLYIYHVFIFIL